MFDRLRHYEQENAIEDKARGHRYPRRLGRFTISAVRDLTTGFDSSTPDGKTVAYYLTVQLTFGFP